MALDWSVEVQDIQDIQWPLTGIGWLVGYLATPKELGDHLKGGVWGPDMTGDKSYQQLVVGVIAYFCSCFIISNDLIGGLWFLFLLLLFVIICYCLLLFVIFVILLLLFVIFCYYLLFFVIICYYLLLLVILAIVVVLTMTCNFLASYPYPNGHPCDRMLSSVLSRLR